MFVRWIDGNRISSLFECDAVSIEALKAEDESLCDSVMVRLQRDSREVATLLLCKEDGHELYVMNNNGKTIDSYQWSDYDGPQVEVHARIDR
jgi:hypothetical protein